MNKEKIYENLVNNSIGNDKKVQKQFTAKQVVLKISLPILMSTIMSAGLSGCNSNIKTQPTSSSSVVAQSESTIPTEFETEPQETEPILERYSKIYENYGVTAMDINTYERQRLNSLLKKYKLTKFVVENGKRNYEYTEKDYSKIKELDDNYIYTFSFVATDDNLLEMLHSIGYETLNDYLISKEYIDKKGNPSTRIWAAANSIEIAEQISISKNIKELKK